MVTKAKLEGMILVSFVDCILPFHSCAKRAIRTRQLVLDTNQWQEMDGDSISSVNKRLNP
jgi:hypothetical protein